METKEKKRRPGTVKKPSGAAGPKTAAPRKPRSAPSRPRKTKAQRAPAPDVVYTQPGPFKRDKFILQLLTVVAVVLALVFGMAIFFKVGKVVKDGVNIAKVYVSGNEKYTEYDVMQASGIKVGENLLTMRKAEVGGRILEQLPYVTKVRVSIKLPEGVNIEVEETDVVYSAQADDESWWLIRSDGVVVEKTNEADAKLHTRVLGVLLTETKIGQNAVAKEPEPRVDETTGETLPVTTTAADQLRSAISILGFLESNSIIGEADSVDVTSLNNLEIGYEDRFRVILGDSTRLGEKIRIMKATIVEMKDYESGILDVSFTLKPDEVVYTPGA